MRRGRIIVITAFLIAIIPALGFPTKWEEIAISVLAIGIAFIGLTLRRPPRQPSLFSEEAPQTEADSNETVHEDEHDTGDDQTPPHTLPTS